MNYILKSLPVGPIEANCYIFGCSKTKEAAVIDPGGDEILIKKIIKENGLRPVCVINTHGHFDHIGANSSMGVPVFIHKADARFLQKKADRLLEGGDRINIGGLALEVIHTPGHTRGSICLKGEDLVFTGDTLFREGIGRSDLSGGSEAEIYMSIRGKLFVLPEDMKVYPGHGGPTTIGHEKEKNPFF